MESLIEYDYSSQAAERQYDLIRKELLHRFLNKNNTSVLMIDAALLRKRSDEQDFIAQINQRQIFKVPVASQYLTEEFYPWLVALDLSSSEDLNLFDKSIELALSEIELHKIKSGNGRLICGWLSIYDDLENACTHLGKTALQRNEDKDILLRYYDPAVATLLWTLLDDWQQQRLLGPVANWYSIDGDGQLNQRSVLLQQYAQLSFSLSLSPELWQDIDMILI
ncbi:DUF4123 domain-containing protein, partial [Serratia marcescens]|uniref:DUF4123 domain-containing protein n=1 Tax=Serratia marcescens TaxID=615 RepID=UPI0011E88809